MLNIARVLFTKRFIQRSEWKWWSSLLAAAAILIVALLLSIAAAFLFSMDKMSESELANGDLPNDALAWAMLCGELLMIAAIFATAKWKSSGWPSNFYLVPVNLRGGWIIAFALLAAIVFGVDAILVHLYPEVAKADIQWFEALLSDPNARLAMLGTVVIGAPVSEELLFRGFMLPSLAKTPLGFWGAATVTTLLWTAIHIYSWQGSLTVMVAGFALSYLLWRTGSILPSIAFHVLINGTYSGIALYGIEGSGAIG